MPDKVKIKMPDGRWITGGEPMPVTVGGEEPKTPRIARAIEVENLGKGRYRVIFDDATGYIGPLDSNTMWDAVRSGWNDRPLLITGPGAWRLADPNECAAHARP
jgi:hypothetical protein